MGCFNSKKSDMSDQASEGDNGNVQYPDLSPLADTHPQTSLETHSPRHAAARELERQYSKTKECARDDLEQQQQAEPVDPSRTSHPVGKEDQTDKGHTVDRSASDPAMDRNNQSPASHSTQSEGQGTNQTTPRDTHAMPNPTSAQSEGIEHVVTDPHSGTEPLPQHDSAPTQDQQQLEPSQQANPMIPMIPIRLDLPTAEDVNRFRQLVPQAAGMTDDEIKCYIVKRRMQNWRREEQAMQQQQAPAPAADPQESGQSAGQSVNTQDQGEVSQLSDVSPRKAYVEDAEDSGL